MNAPSGIMDTSFPCKDLKGVNEKVNVMGHRSFLPYFYFDRKFLTGYVVKEDQKRRPVARTAVCCSSRSCE